MSENKTIGLEGLNIIKGDYEQHSLFFSNNKKFFLIENFCEELVEIKLFIENKYKCLTDEEKGVSLTSHKVIDNNTGLTKCKYTSTGFCIEEGNLYEASLEIEGFIVQSNDEIYFLTTKMNEDFNILAE